MVGQGIVKFLIYYVRSRAGVHKEPKFLILNGRLHPKQFFIEGLSKVSREWALLYSEERREHEWVSGDRGHEGHF